MAFLRLAFFPDGTVEQWSAVVSAVGDVAPPAGRRAFAAGPVAGGWQVMQLWDNRKGLEDFNREVFVPAMADLGSQGFPRMPIVTDVDTVMAWVDDQRL
jgi:hypothetical protein